MNFLGLNTDRKLLDALNRSAAVSMTPQQRLDQRVSFVIGAVDANSSVARERVRQLVVEQQGGTAVSAAR